MNELVGRSFRIIKQSDYYFGRSYIVLDIFCASQNADSEEEKHVIALFDQGEIEHFLLIVKEAESDQEIS